MVARAFVPLCTPYVNGYVGNNPVNFVDPLGLSSCGQNEDCLQKAFGSYSMEKSLNGILGFGIGSAVAGGGLQIWNKSAKKTAEEAAKMIGGGGRSGDYTSYTRRWLGGGIGRTIGRLGIGTIAKYAGILGAGLSAWMMHYDALMIYLECINGR